MSYPHPLKQIALSGSASSPVSPQHSRPLDFIKDIVGKLPLAVAITDRLGRVQACNTMVRGVICDQQSYLDDIFLLFRADANMRDLREWFFTVQHGNSSRPDVTDQFGPVQVTHLPRDGDARHFDLTVSRVGLPPDDALFIFSAAETTELKKAQGIVNHASRLATIGEMATALAHELNQSLNVIGLAADNTIRLLQTPGFVAADALPKLDRIKRQTQHSASIIHNLRIFGRRDQTAVGVFRPIEPVQYAMGLIGSDLALLGIEVDIIDSCPPEVRCTGQVGEIQQVILNLLLNARDAFDSVAGPHHPRIAVMVGIADGEPRTVTYAIVDNAGGIKEQVISDIFQPFVTTKPPGKGTGLGLSISYGIIKQHGGTISASNINGGARFDIRLPARADI